LRVAAGEALSFTQGTIEPRGHAIECRVNAENVAGGRFLPSPGRLTRFSRPGGFGVRIDAGYGEGDTVSQHYDNLIAKVLSWGRDREEARRRMLRVIREITIEGVATNIEAHLRILEHPDFIAGTHSTRWVEERLDFSDLKGSPAVAAPPGGDKTQSPVRRALEVEVAGRRYPVAVWLPADLAGGRPDAASGREGGRPGRSRRTGRRSPGAAAASGDASVVAPMQGTIVAVAVAVGDAVESGATICTLEAMKMENEVEADRAGTVTSLAVAPGQTVEAGDVLAVIE